MTAPSPGTRLVFVEALLADGSSDVVPRAEPMMAPNAQSDLIGSPRPPCKSGTLTVTAVSENPDAVLTAEFNGQLVLGQTRDGKFRGQLVLSQSTSGIVVGTSQFGGCAQRNPLGPGGSQFLLAVAPHRVASGPVASAQSGLALHCDHPGLWG